MIFYCPFLTLSSSVFASPMISSSSRIFLAFFGSTNSTFVIFINTMRGRLYVASTYVLISFSLPATYLIRISFSLKSPQGSCSLHTAYTSFPMYVTLSSFTIMYHQSAQHTKRIDLNFF